jgi:uncharacterized radical SAM protein YgiQ
MDGRGWEECDFIFVSGDAYVDHPSFAAALLCRVLEAEGFRAGIISQPDWKDTSSFTVLGRPRLGFLVGAGSMDSMVAHYTANKRKRSDDAYSPGGKSGLRPDRALLVYVEGIRRAYKDVPVIIGGIEASLRRFAHYDYWSNTVRRSILLDSKADILVYGMGEKPLLQIARRLSEGEAIGDIRDVRGTCVRCYSKKNSHGDTGARRARGEEGGEEFHAEGAESAEGKERKINFLEDWKDVVLLPGYEEVKGKDEDSLRLYAEHFMVQRGNADPLSARPLAELSDGGRWVVQNPPCTPLSTEELDKIYELPFTRKAHPMYDEAGGIDALKEVSFSLVSGRGCFGGCSFCAIGFHQGRAVTGRSKESLLREAQTLAAHQDFKGYIHDVGGPTANFFRPGCEKQKRGGFCADRECLYPAPCPNLKADHSQYLAALKALREIPGVQKVFIRSGIRFDFIQHDAKHGSGFLQTLCEHHVSGQLKVAPEHVSAKVLEAMGKCPHECYEKFRKDFTEINKSLGLKQYLLPYIVSSHPGAGMKEAEELARYLKKTGFVPEQTQDFYPTPGTMSTVMYYTGLDPRTRNPVYVPKTDKERKKQRELLQKN